MQRLVICFENQVERTYIRTATNTKHLMLHLQFEYRGSYFLMQNSQAVNGHRQTLCKSDAKPKHSAEHTVRTALLSPLVIISLTLAPLSSQTSSYRPN